MPPHSPDTAKTRIIAAEGWWAELPREKNDHEKIADRSFLLFSMLVCVMPSQRKKEGNRSKGRNKEGSGARCDASRREMQFEIKVKDGIGDSFIDAWSPLKLKNTLNTENLFE